MSLLKANTTSGTPALKPLAPHGDLRGRRPVNARSLTVGLLGVLFINILTPFNNHVLQNTDLVSNALPIGVLLFLLMFVLLINAPLRRWAPRHALDSGEMSVVLAMSLVSCALPFVGLMRYLPGHLTGLFHWAGQRADYADLLRKAHPPDWLFPTYASADPAQRGNDPIVTQYVGRAMVEQDTFWNHFIAVPWHAWLRPCLAWGAFLIGLFGSILCLMVVFRRQWVENERLQFPLATVYLSLIENPEPGKLLSPVLRHRVFWIAFGLIFLLHALNGLAAYFPRNVPQIPLGYNFNSIFSEEPWRYAEWDFKTQRIFFTVVGVTYFVQTRVAFSLWFTFLCVQVVRMLLGLRQAELSTPMEFDQLFGGLTVFGLTILWVARHHLLLVARQMFRKPAPDEAQGRYLPYWLAGWGLVGFSALLVVWLYAAGATLMGAIVIVLVLLLVYLVLAKLIADTGMPYVLLPLPVTHPWDFLNTALPTSMAVRTTPTSYFFASLFSGILTHDTRQALPSYAMNSMAVADKVAYGEERSWRKAISFTLAMVFALGVAYIASGASTLFCEYKFAASLDRTNTSPINWWGSYGMSQAIVLDPAVSYVNNTQSINHNRFLYAGIGAAVTGTLATCRLTFANWPLHPVGYILAYTWGLRQIWFSIFLGWLLKMLIVKYAGARAFMRAQPFFLGIVLGEVMAAAFWLVMSLSLALMGYEYRAIALLP